MPTPTEYEYFRDVETMALDLVEEYGHDDDAMDDAVHEAIDGSQWVIYYYRARLVLQFSSNDEAGPDEMGWETFVDGATGWSDLYTRGAYFAMRADVSEKIEEILESTLSASLRGDA
jgi:hypothetical protein